MASEQWLLNDTSVVANAFWTPVGSGSYKLKNITWNATNPTRTGTTARAYEGTRSYPVTQDNSDLGDFRSSSDTALGTASYYVDFYYYNPGIPTNNWTALFVTGDNNVNVTFTWAGVTWDNRIAIMSYDAINGLFAPDGTYNPWAQSATNVVPTSAWCRIQARTNAGGCYEIKVFTGSGINGTSPTATVTYNLSTTYPYDQGFNDTYFGVAAYGSDAGNIDSIIFNNTGYPTRGTAYTASATSTATATGTSAITRARAVDGTITETGTGTATGSRGQNLDSTSSITSSATTTAIKVVPTDATSTITATGTSDSIKLIGIGGSSTIDAFGEASELATESFDATATTTVTASIDVVKQLTLDASSSATSSATSTALQTLVFDVDGSTTAAGTSALSIGQSIDASSTIEIVTSAGTGAANTVAGSSSIEALTFTDAIRTVTAESESTVTATGTSASNVTNSLDASGSADASGTAGIKQTTKLNAATVVWGLGTATVPGTFGSALFALVDASSTATATGTTTGTRIKNIQGTATATVNVTRNLRYNTGKISATSNIGAFSSVLAGYRKTIGGTASVVAAGTSSATRLVTAATTTSTVIGIATGNLSKLYFLNSTASSTATGTSTASISIRQINTDQSTATGSGTSEATRVQYIAGESAVTAFGDTSFSATVVFDASSTIETMQHAVPFVRYQLYIGGESQASASSSSEASVLLDEYYLINPSREIAPLSLDPYAEIVAYHLGKTVVKRNGVWLNVQNKREDWLAQCEYVFPGGRENQITPSLKNELELAGYTVETRVRTE